MQATMQNDQRVAERAELGEQASRTTIAPPPGPIMPLQWARLWLATAGVRSFVYHEDRIPTTRALIVVSNHRSALDAPLLMTALGRSVRFACHHYMGQVPGLRDAVQQLGAFVLGAPGERSQSLFAQASVLLERQETVGIFPEGAESMVKWIDPQGMERFHRGVAHLALRATVDEVAILPVAIAPFAEKTYSVVPLRWFAWFDPTEPLFQQEGTHPMVMYERVNVRIGRPRWISAGDRQRYRGREARAIVTEITTYCQSEITQLLAEDPLTQSPNGMGIVATR